MSSKKQDVQEWSIKSYFVPFTTLKAIHLLFFIGLLVYANMLFNTFAWDDIPYIIKNVDFQKLDFWGYFQANNFNTSGQYRPLVALYFSVLHSQFNATPFPYHAIQIFLHLINTSLLFVFFKRYFSHHLAFFLSMIFLVHPIQVESVSFIAATGNNLYFLFGIIAFLLSLRKNSDYKRDIIIFSLLLLSLLSKETGLLFMIMIFINKFLCHRKNLIRYFAFASGTIVIYAYIRFVIGGVFFEKIKYVAINDLTFVERLTNIPAVLLYYLKTFLFPLHLAIDQQWVIKAIDFDNFYLPLLVVALFFFGILLLGWLVYNKNQKLFAPYVLYVVWLLCGLGLHMHLLTLDMTVADRWFYFPIVGFLGVIGFLISLIQKYVNRRILLFLAVLLVMLLATRTFVRNFDWKDEITLYSHDIEVAENAYALENNLSYAYINEEKCTEAKKHAENSIQLYPYVVNHMNLGVSYFCLKNYPMAKKTFLKALEYEDSVQVYYHLANLALEYGDPKENIAYFTHIALNKHPDDVILLRTVAILEYKYGNKENAKKFIEHAYTLDKSDQVTSVYSIIENNRQLNINVNFGRK